MVVTHQPPAQLALDCLPVLDAEFRRSAFPPFGNAVKANQLAAVEEGAREPVRLALLGPDGPTGSFSNTQGVIPW